VSPLVGPLVALAAIVWLVLIFRIVLVAAHGNSLRALVKHLDGISDDELTRLRDAGVIT
jgi:bisphosphoglycerate-dependent phosphoglycerate mutase